MTTGGTRGAGWQIGVSFTVPFPSVDVWAALSGRDGLATWLGRGVDLSMEKGQRYRTASGRQDGRPLAPGASRVSGRTSATASALAGRGRRALAHAPPCRVSECPKRHRQRASLLRGVGLPLIAAHGCVLVITGLPAQRRRGNDVPRGQRNLRPQAVGGQR